MPGDRGEKGIPPMPPTPDNANRDVLSFEEFRARDKSNHPKYDNFWCYFSMGAFSDLIRTKAHYIRFVQENAMAVEALRNKIENERVKTGSTSDSLKPFDQDLYYAYVIMKSYGVSDRDLFS